MITIIVIIATILRVDKINTHAILFPDAAKDILVSIEAVKRKRLPLLGIASSVPRFKQGPVNVWIEMLIYQLFGLNLLAFSIIYALFGILAVVALYQLTVNFVNKKTALIASALLALSPLAVAHSRMIYHTTPIPLTLILYFWALLKLYQKKKFSLFLSVFLWTINFQFELNLFPLILLIPYVIYKSKQKLEKKDYLRIFSALFVGLLPQIIYDLNNGLEQLVAFNVWVIYRIAAFFIPGEHNFSVGKFSATFSDFWFYFQKIFSADNFIVFILFLFLLIIAIIQIIKVIKKRVQGPQEIKLNFLIELSLITSGLLIISYLVKGYPSEAYFPPFFVLLPLIIAYGISLIQSKLKFILLTLLALLLMINLKGIYNHNFFVSNKQNFNYGPSVHEQRQMIKQIANLSLSIFQLASLNEEASFDSYLDNYRLIVKEQGLKENTLYGQKFYIEEKNVERAWPEKFKNYQKIEFTNRDVYYKKQQGEEGESRSERGQPGV